MMAEAPEAPEAAVTLTEVAELLLAAAAVRAVMLELGASGPTLFLALLRGREGLEVQEAAADVVIRAEAWVCWVRVPVGVRPLITPALPVQEVLVASMAAAQMLGLVLLVLVLSASSGAQDAPSLQLIRVTCNG
jgi:hypothetical protein